MTEVERVDGQGGAAAALAMPTARIAPMWLATLQRQQMKVDVAQATYQEIFRTACEASGIFPPSGSARADIDFGTGEVRFTPQ